MLEKGSYTINEYISETSETYEGSGGNDEESSSSECNGGDCHGEHYGGGVWRNARQGIQRETNRINS